MSIYRRDINKTKCMYFMIKEGKAFDIYNEILKKSLRYNKQIK